MEMRWYLVVVIYKVYWNDLEFLEFYFFYRINDVSIL